MGHIPLKLSNFNEVPATAHVSDNICGVEHPKGEYLQLCSKWEEFALRPGLIQRHQGSGITENPSPLASESAGA